MVFTCNIPNWKLKSPDLANIKITKKSFLLIFMQMWQSFSGHLVLKRTSGIQILKLLSYVESEVLKSAFMEFSYPVVRLYRTEPKHLLWRKQSQDSFREISVNSTSSIDTERPRKDSI